MGSAPHRRFTDAALERTGGAAGRIDCRRGSRVAEPVRHNQVMPWRRLLLFAVLLIVGASLVSAMASRDRRADDSPNAGAEASASAPPASVVEASLPGDKEVRARVGDVVRLLVRAPAADVVELSTLAVEEPVDADRPTELLFVADRAGRFRVHLRDADESIGTVRVTS
jgi:hypothetical protein